MIEINLLPGGTRRSARKVGGGRFKLPKLSAPRSMPNLDRILAFAVAAWIIGPLVLGWLFFSTRSEMKDLQLKIEKAQQDSTRYAAVITSIKRLEARRDTISQKLQVIQNIDGDRYIWPHIMDEVSRALPDYTWLTKIQDLRADTAGGPKFQIEGRTGSNFALTEFMKDLEASPFIKNVTLVATQQIQLGETEVYSFTLRATWENPPADLIQTVPLFPAQEASHGAAPE